MQSPVKKIFITQVFGVNKANYAKFGLEGHNGIDFRAFLPDGERCYIGGKSEIFAPHDGKVIENALDSNGFGWYIKIEDGKQGSVLGHMSSQSNCKVGSSVKMGDFIGFQGTTGNSTGIHLHWGWYPIPRNKANGFNGYENQEGKYAPFGGGNNMDTITIDKTTFESLVTKSSRWDEVLKLGYTSAAQIEQEYKSLKANVASKAEEVTIAQNQAEANRKHFNELLANAAKALGTVQEVAQVNAALAKVSLDLDTLSDLQRQFGELQINSSEQVEELNAEIARLKALVNHTNVLEESTMEELLKEIIKRLAKIIKLA